MSSAQADADIPDPTPWFVEHYPRLLRVAWFCTRDQDRAHDIAQEASVKILKAWPDPRQRELILTSPSYSNTIVRNVFYTQWKRQSPMGMRETPLADEHDKELISSDIELRLAILELPEEELAMLLFRYEGYTIVEAGRILGLSAGQAYRLNTKAERSLDGLIKDH